MSDREIVLSYHDAIIRSSDYQLLKTNEWINDSLIEFWFEYLQNDLYKGYENELLCLSPSLSQLIKLTKNPEEIDPIVESLNIGSKKLILIPINDSQSYEDIGGTHWSLLVYVSEKNLFEYYDSAECSGNMYHAKNLVKNIQHLLPKSSKEAVISKINCHQQYNSYNCGIHLICNSDAVCKIHLQYDQRKITDIYTIEMIEKFRPKLMAIIDSLK